MNSIRRWKIIMCLLLVALSGAVIGGVATHWWMTQHAPNVDAASLSASRLQRVLKLDAAQTAQVRGMFERWLVETEALAPGDVEGRVRLRRQYLSELEKLLTPEQRTRFEVLTAPNREAQAAVSDLPMLRDFHLTDAAGQSHALADYRSRKLIVLLFLGTECPVSNGYAPEFRRIAEEYAAQNVAVLGVHSDPSVTAQAAREHAVEYQLTFPILVDSRQTLARALGIATVPETVVMLPTGAVIYRGRVDDRYSTAGKRRDVPRSQELRDAITAGVAGKSPAIAETKPFGCALPGAPPIRGNISK